MTKTIQVLAVALLLGLPVTTGCGASRTSAFDDGTTPASQDTASPQARARHDELVAQGDAAFALRDQEPQLRAAIEAYTQAVDAVPGAHETWTKLARAQYLLAYGHMEFDTALEAETTAMYQSAITSAERGLAALSPAFAQQVRASGQLTPGLPSLDATAVPLLYWRSSALGRWARRAGLTAVLQYKDEIRATMNRALELDREFFFGGPDRYFGTFFAVAPSYAGGDLERARQHFDYSITRYPNYFGTRVLYAIEYAVKVQDRALFTRELEWVLAQDPAILPEASAENIIEQRRAREALARVDELFE